MKLIYSPQARVDLREIKAYIRDNLQNPTAAENIHSFLKFRTNMRLIHIPSPLLFILYRINEKSYNYLSETIYLLYISY